MIFQIDAKIHTDIFVKRNERIARRIKKELDEKPNGRFFIAVGTGQSKHQWFRDLLLIQDISLAVVIFWIGWRILAIG